MVAGTHGWQDWDDPAPDDHQAFVWQDGVTRSPPSPPPPRPSTTRAW
ncbi:hypothetical protein [Micromonospora sp. NPDC005305]